MCYDGKNAKGDQKMKACFATNGGQSAVDFLCAGGRKEQFARKLDLLPGVVTQDTLAQRREELADVEVLISTWGMLPLTEEEIGEYFPSLRLILYGAASVQYFGQPFLRRGIRITTAAMAMAEFVAQFTFAQIVQANKGYSHSIRMYREKGYEAGHLHATRVCPGTYDTTVGIIGAGAIGTLVIEYLKKAHCEVLVFDPFLPDERAAALGVEKVSLEELFSRSHTISNHLANNAQTVGMLNYDLFRRMKPDAAFINTGRGAQVVEADLARAMREEPMRCALLDVTDPEPCPPDHEFWQLPNVILTPHIAGSAVQEMWGFADQMLEELERYQAGEALKYEVTLDMLATRA